jgi:hypothetical protein
LQLLLPQVPADLQGLYLQLAQRQPALYGQAQASMSGANEALPAAAAAAPAAMSLQQLLQQQQQYHGGADVAVLGAGIRGAAVPKTAGLQQQLQVRGRAKQQQQQQQLGAAGHFSALEALAEAAAAAALKVQK